MTQTEALNIAIDYMNERLEEHDAKYQRHSATEAERNNILADIETVKTALAQQSNEQVEPVNKYCCHLCFNKSGQLFLDRMILCSDCGNKRCPKATHHELQCTKSNEPNQTGSVYTHPPVPTAQPKEPEQEPVAWTEQRFYDDGTPNPCSALKWAGRNAEDDFPVGTKFYTTPPQRKPLDIKTIKRIATYCGEHITDEDVIEITRRVEEEHKIKE